MEIKLKEFKRVEGTSDAGKEWVAYVLVGTKLEDGSPWTSSKMFDNQYNVELIDKARELEIGETYNVVHKKNKAGFWQISGFKKIDGPSKKQYKGTGSGGKSTGWSGRKGEAYDRSAAIYLAMDIMKTTVDGEDLKQVEPEAMVGRLIELADGIFEYINNGVTFVKGTGDGLEPPPE